LTPVKIVAHPPGNVNEAGQPHRVKSVQSLRAVPAASQVHTDGLLQLRKSVKRGWNAVEHRALFAAIAMSGAAWIALETGQPDKLRSARTWISLD